ncbi:pectinesterase family protein [Paenibacillus sp. KR2-11]|uniref:pectinesterase family protein n=1 Tax=Paenibacillus sp. KR2-11 TaxID=3385500 RepID=UPI0038FCADB9
MRKASRILLCLLLLFSYVPWAGAGRTEAASFPTGWSSIGLGGSSGSSSYDASAGEFAISDSTGTGVPNQVDEQLQYAYTPVTGDFTMMAKLTSYPYVKGAMAGILARTSLEKGSSFFFGNYYGTNDQYQPYVSSRLTSDPAKAASNSGLKQGTDNVLYDFESAPKYMRVRKQGGGFYYDLGTVSGPTITWTQINGKTIADVQSTTYVGLASAKAGAAARFDSVTLLHTYTNSQTTDVSDLTAALPVSAAVPAAPSGLKAETGDARVQLTWGTVTDATYYNVRRSQTSGGGYSTIAEKLQAGAGAASASYTDSSVTNNTTYSYVVTALNASGESGPSAEVQATPSGQGVPAAPANVTAAPGDGELTLAWTSVPGAAAYEVKRSTTPGGPYSSVAADVTGTSFLNAGLTNGTLYYYVVSAVNAAGAGPDSAEAAGKPGSFLIHDTFENSTLGALPSGYTAPFGNGVISAFTNTNNTTVIHNSSLTNSYGNTSGAVADNATNVLWINDGAGRGGFNKAFAPITAESKKGVTAQLRFMQTARIGDSYVLELLDSNKKTAVSFNINASPVTISGNTWYTVKYVADVAAGTADLFVNGQYQGNVAFTTPVADMASVNFRMAGSSSGQAYVDDVTAYTQETTTPQSLTAEGANLRVELNWNAASGVDSYNVYRSASQEGPYALVAGSVPSNSYSDTTAGLANNTYFYYKVTGVNANGESDVSNTAEAYPNDVPPPSAPITGLKAVVRDGQLTITWDPVKDPANPKKDATFYTLERSTTPAGPYVSLLVNGKPRITDTSYLDAGLNSGTTYYYRLTAGNVGGLGEPVLLGQVSPAAPLQSPTLLSAEPGRQGVELTWSSVPNAASYHIERSEANGGAYTTVGTVNDTGYTDATAQAGKTYYYVVTAVNEQQESRISNQLRVKHAAVVPGAPEKPAGLKAAVDDGGVTLSWNPVPGAASYNIKRADSPGGSYTTMAVSGEASYQDQAVTNGTTYYYVVSAVKAGGESVDSDEIAALPAKVLTVDKRAAADGVTVFNTIQSAVDIIPADNSVRTVISIAPGTYTEKLKVTRPYVSLVGAGIDVTSIVYGDYAGTSATTGKPGHVGNTFLSQTVEVNADYFTAANLTIENSSGPRSDVAQAVALSLKSDMAVFESVRLKGYQDTLYNGLNAKNQGRHYFHNSLIEGDVDFIFGEAPAVVMDNVRMVLVSHTGGGGHITAGAQKNVADKGYLFLNSQVVDDASAQGSYDLGRPWKDYARVSFINTLIDSKKFLPGGWVAACAGTCKTSYFSEYNSYGLGANASARTMATQLTGQEASMTIPAMFDGWDPSTPVFMPKVQYKPAISASFASFDKANGADVYVTVRNGSGYTLTSVKNGDTALDSSAYKAAGSGYVIRKSYLAGLPEGTASLTFQYDGISVPLLIHIVNSGSTDLGREVLAANDGWASFTTGTTGGSAASSDNIFVVSSRSELVKAAAGNTPKIIYIQGSIDMNVDDNNHPVGREYYEDPAYDLEEYLKTYDPAVWGKNSPAGPLEDARAKSQANQASRIKVTVGSNTTIVGLPGSGAKILGGSLNLDKVDNIIIRNIEFENTFDHFPQWDPTDGESGNWNSAYDSVSVKGSTHVWIDHNVFSDDGGLDDPKHTYFGRKYQQHDGTVDITNASDLVTVSYNHFHDHDKTTLIGGSDEATGDAGKLRVTIHHNYYENAGQRVPRVRYGQVHVYNNYYAGSYTHPTNPYVYSLGVGYESQIYAQNNYFVNDPGTQPAAIIQVSKGTKFTDTGSVLNGTDVNIAQSHGGLQAVAWTPTLYTTLDDTKEVPVIVKAQAGVFEAEVPGDGTGGETEEPGDGAGGETEEPGDGTGSDDDDHDNSGGSSGGSAAPPASNGSHTNTGSSKPGGVKLNDFLKESVQNGTVLVTLDASKAAEFIAGAPADTTVFQMEAGSEGNTVKVEVTSELLKALYSKNKGAILQIDSANGSYSLPVKLLDTSVLARQHLVSESDVKLYILIRKVQGGTAEGVKGAASKLGATILGEPVSFEILVDVKGKTEAIDTFDTYVGRKLKLQGEVNPQSAAGVMYDPQTQKLVPVPTLFEGAEATMLRRGNSIYTVIEHSKTFGDLNGHWAKKDVETLAGKLIVEGVSPAQFAPDGQVTRAEFAALLVRALGLTEEQAVGFADVTIKDWFSGAVGAAKKANLISGYEDGTFQPHAAITREQMVTMMVRALKLGGLEAKTQDGLLEKFSDHASVAGWAREAAAISLSAGLIEGISESRFAPQDNATRAQAAVMLKRTLQQLHFMNP